MGILQSKKVKQKENHPYNKDIKNGTTKEAADSQGVGPTQLINHQMEPSNSNDAMTTKMDQGRTVDAPELQDLSENLSPPAQVLQKTTPTVPMQQQTDRQKMCGHSQPEETRNFTLSQQNPAAKKTTGVTLQMARAAAPCDKGMRTTRDSVHSSAIFPSVQVSAQVLCKDTFPQLECSSWSTEEQETVTQLFGSKMQEALPHKCIEIVRSVPTENLHGKEAEAQTKAKITKSPSQKSKCVLSNMNVACHATDKAHNIEPLITTAKSGLAEEHTTKPAESLDHTTQMSNQPNTQVNNKETALRKHCLNQDSVTNVSVVYQYWVMDKSERGRANAAKIRLRQKLAKQLKAPPGDGSRSSQQTTEETVTIVPESSQQQICTALDENPVKKHKNQQLIPQPNKADYGNTSPCMQKVSMKAVAPHVPVVEKMPTAAPNNGATQKAGTDADTNVKLMLQFDLKVSQPQDTVAVKLNKKCTPIALKQNQPTNNTGSVIMEEKLNGKNGQVEKQEPDITAPVNYRHKVCGEGRWPQFTLNPSCPRKVRCKHNPGTGLPPNVQKWIDNCPNEV
ncbi:uncharacterized protein LOC130167911 [Seriola aureovittata]|uniref:uncharacterized protein LOC130167911 n=1 Tax=Seriola aureovittata TaxID=2871759 RepID=UPI0024BE1D26|nr:uncharacterized protein LOC130167911 [Seriola aureovittata]